MLTSEISDDVIIYSFDKTDKLNTVNSETLKKEISGHFNKRGTRVILDLGNIVFIDSSGFAALLSILRNVRSNSGIFCLCNITPDVMSLFRLLQLHRIFQIFDNRKECLESFDQSQK